MICTFFCETGGGFGTGTLCCRDGILVSKGSRLVLGCDGIGFFNIDNRGAGPGKQVSRLVVGMIASICMPEEPVGLCWYY